MKLLVLILNDQSLIEPILESYLEAGVPGATILDSEGMGHFLSCEVPLFADFKDFMRGAMPRNKTILSVIRDESVLPVLYGLLDGVLGGFGKPGNGIMFTLPIDWTTLSGSPPPGACL
jgi:hypothetical protein